MTSTRAATVKHEIDQCISMMGWAEYEPSPSARYIERAHDNLEPAIGPDRATRLAALLGEARKECHAFTHATGRRRADLLNNGPQHQHNLWTAVHKIVTAADAEADAAGVSA